MLEVPSPLSTQVTVWNNGEVGEDGAQPIIVVLVVVGLQVVLMKLGDAAAFAEQLATGAVVSSITVQVVCTLVVVLVPAEQLATGTGPEG